MECYATDGVITDTVSIHCKCQGHQHCSAHDIGIFSAWSEHRLMPTDCIGAVLIWIINITAGCISVGVSRSQDAWVLGSLAPPNIDDKHEFEPSWMHKCCNPQCHQVLMLNARLGHKFAFMRGTGAVILAPWIFTSNPRGLSINLCSQKWECCGFYPPDNHTPTHWNLGPISWPQNVGGIFP